jgi:cysteine synthase
VSSALRPSEGQTVYLICHSGNRTKLAADAFTGTGFSDTVQIAGGTGGTLAGTSQFLQDQNPEFAAICANPFGSSMWSWFMNGNTDTDDGDSFAEGIGASPLTAPTASRIRRR